MSKETKKLIIYAGLSNFVLAVGCYAISDTIIHAIEGYGFIVFLQVMALVVGYCDCMGKDETYP